METRHQDHSSDITPAATGSPAVAENQAVAREMAASQEMTLAQRMAVRRRRARQRSRAFTLIEMMIVLEVIMILAAMALPNIKVSRKAADETAAVMGLRQLADAQELYRPRQSPPAYAPSLERLRTAGLIDESLATTHRKSGYYFMVNGFPDNNTYAFTATADIQGSTGDRSFYVDQTGVIRMASDAGVSSLSPPM